MAEAWTELAPHYYRDNFQRLCDAVTAQYGDLLRDHEHALLQGFSALEFSAQCLYVRLVTRVGPLFRTSAINYPELGDCELLLEQLLAAEMVQEFKALPLEQLARLFTRQQLVNAFAAELQEPVSQRKAELLASIKARNFSEDDLYRLACAETDERIVMPAAGETVQLLQLLFFGNRYQSLTDFVLSDLGVACYYPYELDPDQRLFYNRKSVEEYLHCCSLHDLAREQRDSGDVDGLCELAQLVCELPPPEYPPTRHRRARLCNFLGREMERCKEPQLALALYRDNELHPARERRARVMEATRDFAGAARLCRAIIANPWGEEEQEAARRILTRAERKLGERSAPIRRDRFPRLELELKKQDSTVESLAALALQEHWPAVHYVENHLFNALFGLAFWEQIFSPVPGAFHHPYQSIPADMYQQSFQQQRNSAINARLKELADIPLEQELVKVYDRCQSYQCRWVNWRRISRQLVAEAASVIPAEHLLAIWKRMMFDPRENRRGFPDLIALGACSGDYQLIEVKGPGDALQDGQKRWLRFFAQWDIPATVAWVQWDND